MLKQMGRFGLTEGTPDASGEISQPRVFHISDDILFHLGNGIYDAPLDPGKSVTMTYTVSNPEEAQAFQSGNVVLKSRAALVGVRLASILVDPQEGTSWQVSVEIENTGPLHLHMPQEYPLLRWYTGDENALSGEELLQVALEMGDANYILLEHNETRDALTIADLEALQLAKAFPPGELAKYDTVILPYSKEVGILTPQTGKAIDFGNMPARRDNLEAWAGLSWGKQGTPLSYKQQVFLQRTAHAAKIPKGFFGLVQYEGVDDTPDMLRHGAARALNPVSDFSAYNWPIFAESEIPRHPRFERSDGKEYSWVPSSAMRVKLYRTV